MLTPTGLLVTACVPPAAFLLFVARMRRRRGLASVPEVVGGGVLRVRNAFTDVYAARAGGRVLLFDAGFDPRGRAVDRLLAALGAGRDAVSDVFLSHGHFDHVAATPLFPGARVHVGAGDVAMLAQRSPTRPWGVRVFDRALPVPPVEATHALAGRVRVSLADGTPVTALPFPGHTPGSYLMLFRGVLFTGDSLRLSGGRLHLALPPFSVDMRANRRSAAGLLELLAGEQVDVICTGHQGCTSAGQAQALLADLVRRASCARGRVFAGACACHAGGAA